MAEKKDTNNSLFNIIDRIKGDKVIWIVVTMLILYSIVAIFSSSTLLLERNMTRLDVFMDQAKTVAMGMAVILVCYFFLNERIFRFFSQFGFAASLVMLIMLVFEISTVKINGAVRAINIFGLHLQVYEFVKVFMVMYLAWAIQSYKTDSFWVANWLSTRFDRLEWIGKPWCKRIIYIYIPVFTVTILILQGGFSSAMFIGVIMLATVMIGGIPFKDILILAISAVAGIALIFGIGMASDWKALGDRGTTIQSRLEDFFHPVDPDKIDRNSQAWQNYLDDIRQPEGAKIAMHEGGLFGKGPGRSTQKYSTALMFSDYMFSFIVEEYGILFGAIPLIILYISLLARGSIIVRYCKGDYAKTVIAGLCLLITGQAMLHMYVNAGLGPLTGQTLPMVSHGDSSFLAFSIAFGVLLSLSKLAKENIAAAAREAVPLIAMGKDEVSEGLNDLDDFETEIR